MAGYVPMWLLELMYPIEEPSLIRDRPLEVLALGLGRTGTESLALALKELGYGDVYHGWETSEHPGCYPQWVRLGMAKYSQRNKDSALLNCAEFDKIIGHCGAVTDLPTAAFGPEMMRCYPDAKVILNRRDDVDAWYESQKKTINAIFTGWQTILPALFEPSLFWGWQCVRLVVWAPAGNDFSRNGKIMYHEHYAKLEAECREQGREWLDWKAQDEWAPLCKFLGKPVPDSPFPNINAAGNFEKRRGNLHMARSRRAWRRMVGAGILATLGAGLAWYQIRESA
ncbi:hypothetical protein LTR27_012450 [Elasticomyces elasticus]|nr:hypothetical protein LTR27_012450 [Elasticomyces elasticus]